MLNNVGNIDFWKKRLENAERSGTLHWSVYLANPVLMRKIDRAHKNVFDTLIPIGSSVLDAGCGYGRLCEFFDNYTGVDFSPDFIKKAKELYPHKVFIQADLQKLPFRDGEFDWAFCVSIKDMIREYDSVEKWDNIEKELGRVAKKILVLEYTEPEKYIIL